MTNPSTHPFQSMSADDQNQQDQTSANGQNGSEGASDAQFAELQKRVSELEAQVKDKESKHLYLYAEFENYKKRAIKERSDAIRYGWEPVARDLLEVIDNLERALTHMPEGTSKTLIDGIHMVLNQFRATIQKQGVQPIEALNQPFDPNFHEAVGQEPSDHPEGTIVREHQKGYTLHGRLLRPSRVIVSGKS